MGPTMVMLCGCLLVTTALAQARPDEKAHKEALKEVLPRDGIVELRAKRRPELSSPFANPSLASADPAEVAWAAHELADDGERRADAALFAAALRAMRAGKTPQHERAVLHLLHVAMVRGLVLPTEDLRLEPQGRARIPWIVLQVRAAPADGGALFELFHRLDEAPDAGWEVVGGALAIRNHLAFAIELRTRMVPRLHVHAERRTSAKREPRIGDAAPEAMEGFPHAPVSRWKKDRFGIEADLGTNQHQEYQPGERDVDLARLRWLAELAGEPMPQAWAQRFDVLVPGRDMTKFVAGAVAAEARARESLERADATFRERFRVPERRRFPELVVVWQDGRSEAERKALPMPPRPK